MDSRKALVVVLDSVGVGYAPDAADYGDAGANTLGHILERNPKLRVPNLKKIGLDSALALAAGGIPAPPERGSVGVLTELSAGKDTTTGHWELAGVVLEEPFPVYERFPDEMVAAIEAEANVSFIGNRAASGTAILDELGAEHVQTGRPILYTSADSVLQIAAHQDVLPLEKLYAICATARKHAGGIGRVIARPFVGEPGNWKRTAHRHDFSLTPPRTVLNALEESTIPVTGVGKISDIFAGSGITESHPTKSNADGMAMIDRLWDVLAHGLIFANLVDFDMLFGHRRDANGYAVALEELDEWLGQFLPRITPHDLVIITADHGNDPTAPGTDHTRERIPVFVPSDASPSVLGVQKGFGWVADRVAGYFGLPSDWRAPGKSG
ncbi:MAG: phosphopentomutase [Terrimicrobiaceae bacterium]|nr:phosphopentomutase [Terrimicrobiaceae bacterium]